MPKVKEILVRKEWNGQVWYEYKPVESFNDAEGKAGSDLEPTRSDPPKPPKLVDLGRK